MPFLRCAVLFIMVFVARVGSAQASAARPENRFATLPNGLRVVVQARHVSPLVAIDLWVRAGAREEQAGEEGSAHFLEHTLFKGTATRKAGEVDAAIETLGGTLNAATGPDYAHFYTTVPAAHLSAALLILADVIRRPTLPDADVNRERGVILDELAAHDGNGDEVLVDRLFELAFALHPYRRSPGGTQAQIAARGRDTLAAFHRRCYTPGRCILVLVGSVEPESAQDAARQAFGDWREPFLRRAGGSAQPVNPTATGREESFSGERERIAPAPDGIARVGLAFPAPPASDTATTAAALVTVMLLGATNRGGRLDLPELAAGTASARFTPRLDSGLFLLTLRAKKQNALSLDTLTTWETALRAVVNGLGRVGTAELATAKERAVGRLMLDGETNADIAHDLGYATLVGGDAPQQLRARILRLQPADVAAFARAYFRPDRSVVVRLTANRETEHHAR